MWCLELNPGLLEKQPVFLMPEPSLQSYKDISFSTEPEKMPRRWSHSLAVSLQMVPMQETRTELGHLSVQNE
ncbi:hypothetical protein LEMLEM_LOCUS24142, partial [Lemmus lemmus]